jgi:hypothetical protein
MALETQTDYLDHIYLQVKNRPLRDGELNLLPDDTEPGFANTVRCVPESEEGTTDTTEMTRKMQFERVSLKDSEELICVHLVINLPPDFSEDGEVVLYETSDDPEHRKELDKASMPSCHSTCWFELSVGVENLQDSMEFTLEFTHTDTDFLLGLNPMMVLYTYVDQPLSDVVTKRHAPDYMTARHDHNRERIAPRQDNPTTETPEEEEQEYTNPLLTELESRGEPCAKQTVRLPYSQIRWINEDITIVSPSVIHLDFCYGHCNTQMDLLRHDTPGENYDKRVRILEVVNRLSENRLTPPPCCVPLSYLANEVIFAIGDYVAMTTFPSVETCGCRA